MFIQVNMRKFQAKEYVKIVNIVHIFEIFCK